MRPLPILLLLACLALPDASWAQATPSQPAQSPPPAKGAARAACRDDVQHLCAGIQPGGGRIAQCLKSHSADLSDGCKTALAAARAQRQDAKAGNEAQ